MRISDIRKYISSLNETFSPGGMDWLPETLEMELHDRFGSQVTDDDLEFLLTILALLKADDAWHDELVFEKVSHIISGVPASFDRIEPLAPSQAVRGILVMKDLREGMPFGHNIRAYITAVMLSSGITWVPDDWSLPEGINEMLAEERSQESLAPGVLSEAYEQRKSFDFEETHLSYVIAQMIVVDEMIGLV